MTMLTCPQHYLHLHHSPPRNPNFSSISLNHRKTITCAAHSSAPNNPRINQVSQDAEIATRNDYQPEHHRWRRDFRRHNEKSLNFLKEGLSENPSLKQWSEVAVGDGDDNDDKLKLLEMSLITKRTPQFPGSLYSQSSSDADVSSSLPPLSRVIDFEADGGVDNEMILKAIEIRRKVTRQIFLSQMRKGKFAITYSENTLSVIPEFIDYVMIEAARMKNSPEFAESSFNVRATVVIEESGVVPLIRYCLFYCLCYSYFVVCTDDYLVS